MVLASRKFLAALLLTSAALPALAEDGVTDTTVLVGQTVGVTGTVAGPVKEMNEGAMAHLDQVSTSLGQEFAAAAKESNVTASYAAMEGFVNAKVLVEALRRAGPKLTRAGFVRALESMQRVDFGDLMVTYGPNDHTGSEFVELTMIGKNGRFVR